MAEEEITAQMAEGEMNFEVGPLKIYTKGFRLYSLILFALVGYLAAVWYNSPQVAGVQTVLVFLLGVFTGKKT